MHIFITSVGSYIGLYLTSQFLSQGHLVTGTYRTLSPTLSALSLNSRLTLIPLEHSYDSAYPNIEGSFNLLINCTGAYPDVNVSADDVVYANIKSASLILSLSKTLVGISIINLSSLSIYGDLKIPLIDSHTNPSPSTPYGSTKLLSEQILNQSHNFSSLVHIRLPVVLGDGAHRAWLPSLLSKLSTGASVSVYNPDSIYNTCTTLHALSKFILKLSSLTSLTNIHHVNLSSIGDLSIREIVLLLTSRLNSSSDVSFSSSSTPCCYVKHDAAVELGFMPTSTSQAISYWLDESQL
ncbi:NAD(P)-dependent oxidoreductase [Synechococcus sp. A15-24]|uniref:NAD-dependent epimerase/dehydratase family protein n=1 Tax=Synechococcus sp. A15-24 TaxID=1050635 RepID=UPI00164760EC|nr:NAD(P)-dependent oxidoreductase [Synechococcus sp. A15-24]QNJ27824.1 NAD dependent epimerase/dehydratase family protein [Synechococcus sp. A15-24]